MAIIRQITRIFTSMRNVGSQIYIERQSSDQKNNKRDKDKNIMNVNTMYRRTKKDPNLCWSLLIKAQR
jgi:hypothetical protein